jgi:nitric oxide reductase subunit B
MMHLPIFVTALKGSEEVKPNRKLWQWLGVVFVLSFAALGFLGREIYLAAPPIANVVTSDGKTLYTSDEVQRGQQVWLASGGQQLGTVWGHGSYVAPDWSADWLHREAVTLRELYAQQAFERAYDALATADKAAVDATVKAEMRANTYDAKTNTVTVSPIRAKAMAEVAKHYEDLFGNDASLEKLREQYAMGDNLVTDAADRKALTGFFFWSSWSAATDRPGETGESYTSNWPHEPIIGNTMTTSSAMWSIASIILLIGGIAGMIWFHSAHKEEPDPVVPKSDPLINAVATPSSRRRSRSAPSTGRSRRASGTSARSRRGAVRRTNLWRATRWRSRRCRTACAPCGRRRTAADRRAGSRRTRGLRPRSAR